MKLAAFYGETYNHDQDYARLSNNLQRVFVCMKDGEWHTETDLRPIGGSRWSGRVRDLRGLPWGPLIVESERLEGSLWRYRIDLDSLTPHIAHKIMERKPDTTVDGVEANLANVGTETTRGRAIALLRKVGVRATKARIAAIEAAFRAEQRRGFAVAKVSV